jgi:hypothetical protein
MRRGQRWAHQGMRGGTTTVARARHASKGGQERAREGGGGVGCPRGGARLLCRGATGRGGWGGNRRR